jgi:outer membrane protein assembly factor BamB
MHGYFHDSEQTDSESLSASTAANLGLLWSYHSLGPIVTQPMVTNDSVYFGSWDGHEYSVYATNGTLRWATNLGQSRCTPTTSPQGVSSSATIWNNTVYVGGGADYWYALSASTGSVLWKVFTGNSSPQLGGGHFNWASPFVNSGYAYLGIASHCDLPLVQGMLLKVDLQTHRVVRSFNTTTPTNLGASIWSSPAFDPATGEIYAATGNLKSGTNSTLDDSILALNSKTLHLDGRFQVPYAFRYPDGDFGASPTLYTDSKGVPVVVDANKDGYLFALRANNLGLGPIWQLQLATGRTFASAAYENGMLYVGSGKTVNSAGQTVLGELRAIDATTGKVRWAVPLAGNDFTPVTIADGIAVAAAGRQMLVVRLSDGQVLYEYNATAQFDGGASIAGGRIFIGNNNGDLLAFGFPLSASISKSGVGASRPLALKFTGHVTGGAGGYQFAWKFGDGGTSILGTPYHSYTRAGKYTVTLRVSDQAWNVVTTQVTITVNDNRSSARPVPGRRSPPPPRPPRTDRTLA